MCVCKSWAFPFFHVWAFKAIVEVLGFKAETAETAAA